MSTPEECVILDIPQGLRLNLLGLIGQIDRVRIVADRAGLLGGLLASLTCGGIESAERLDRQHAELGRPATRARGSFQQESRPFVKGPDAVPLR
jgi:hypothetical protein